VGQASCGGAVRSSLAVHVAPRIDSTCFAEILLFGGAKLPQVAQSLGSAARRSSRIRLDRQTRVGIGRS